MGNSIEAAPVKTNVRWQFDDDVIEKIAEHQRALVILWGRKVTQQEAVQDLIRSKKLPKIIITHEE